MAEFNVQQKATIDNYRSTHKLGFVVTDEYVAELIKKEMEQTGVVYAGFESLAKSVAKSQIKQLTQNTNTSVKTNATASIFGTQIVDNEFDLGFSGKTTNTYPEIQPTESQSEAINFLKDITSDAETTFKNREDEAGALSTVVNTWQEVFNKQYAKSTVKKELQAAREDLKLLEQASRGQIGYTDFLGNTYIKSFEDVFKQRRGVKFDEKAVADCTEKAEQFAAIKTSVEMINQTKQILGYTTKGDVHSQMNPQEASSAIIKAFQLSGINSLEEMNKTLQDIEQKYKNHPDIQKYGGNFKFAKNKQGQYVIYRIAKSGYPAEATNEQLRVIAKEMGLRLDKALATALGVEYSANATSEEMANLTQQTYDKYQKEYEDSFAKAYGKKDVKALAEAYVLKQQQGVANIEMGLNIASMALMVVPGGAVATSGWALKGALLAKHSATGAKVVKGLQLVDKAKTFVKGAQTLQKISQVASPFIMANMTLRPTELLEQLTSKNGMSAEEWKTWGQGVLQNSIYMAAGMGASKLAETGAAMYKTKALVNTLKSAGKSTDEIIAMVKANPVKFPNEIVKSFNKIDNIAKALQVTSEVALDLGSTIALNKVMNNGELLPMDVVNSIAFALMGGVVQKDIARLNGNVDKIDFILKEFKEFGVTEADAKNILQAMDDISTEKIRAKNVKPLDDHHDTQMLDEVVITAERSRTEADGQRYSTNDVAEVLSPRGLTTEEDALIQQARTENPADVVADKVKQQWLEDGLHTRVEDKPVDLFNLDPNAGLKQPAPEVNCEVTSLIFTGKLKDVLTKRYDEMGRVFNDIAKNRSADFKKLAQECGTDKQAFADGVIAILAEEMGMKGLEPKIEVVEIASAADGLADWTKGTIKIGNNVGNAKKLIEIISHEFVHMLQYRDVLAQYGEQGLREIVMNDKSIPASQKEAKIKEILESDYTKELLNNFNKLQNSEIGSLNEYITRIYKDELANLVDPDVDMQGYVDQVTEREAYNLGSEQLGNNTEGLDNLAVDANGGISRSLIAQILEKRQSQGVENEVPGKIKSADYEIDEFGQIHKKNIPAGITESSKTSQNLFSRIRKLFISDEAILLGKIKKALGTKDFKRIEDKLKESGESLKFVEKLISQNADFYDIEKLLKMYGCMGKKYPQVQNIILMMFENKYSLESIKRYLTKLEEIPLIVKNKKVSFDENTMLSLINLQKMGVDVDIIFSYTKLKIENPDKSSFEILQKYNENFNSQEMIKSRTEKEIFNEIYALLVDIECNGIKIDKQALSNIFSNYQFHSVEATSYLTGSYAKIGKKQFELDYIVEENKKAFNDLINLIQEHDLKDGEKISEYYKRINELRMQRNTNIEAEHIKEIKKRLESGYSSEDIGLEEIKLTPEEQNEFDKRGGLKYWIAVAGDVTTNIGAYKPNGKVDKFSAIGLQKYPRYNSSKYIKKTSEYTYEPVYRVLQTNGATVEKFLEKNFPQVGESIQFGTLQCCSPQIGSAKGESTFNANENFPIQMIIHPKSETSQAHFIRGNGEEIRYGGNVKFKVIDKYIEVQDIDQCNLQFGTYINRQVIGVIVLQEL